MTRASSTYKGKRAASLATILLNRIEDLCHGTGREDLVEALGALQHLAEAHPDFSKMRPVFVDFLERDDQLVECAQHLETYFRQRAILSALTGGTIQ